MLPARDNRSLIIVLDPARKELGEVLVEKGYSRFHHIIRGINIYGKLFQASMVAIAALLSLSMPGCGSVAGGNTEARVPAVSSPATPSTTVFQNVSSPSRTNYLKISESEYNFSVAPNFYYSSDNQAFWSIQANVANSLTDINSRNVIRIDIPKTGVQLPQLNRAFSIGGGGEFEKFPGTFTVLDGQQSSAKKVEAGTIIFSPDSVMSENVSGSFSVTLTDYDSPAYPAPKYSFKGVFSFRMGDYGPAT